MTTLTLDGARDRLAAIADEMDDLYRRTPGDVLSDSDSRRFEKLAREGESLRGFISRQSASLTLEQCQARAAALVPEMEALHRKANWTRGESERYLALDAETTALAERADDQKARGAILARAATQTDTGDQPARYAKMGTPTVTTTRAFGGSDLADDAKRTIDAAFRSKQLPDHAAEKATALVTNGTAVERTVAARWAATTGDPAYRTAFVKLVADPARGHLTWTADEAEAYRAVETFRTEVRGMSLTDANGGYMIPLTLDPAIMVTNDGVISPIRRLARTETISTDAWYGVSSAGVVAEWLAEATQVADASPTLAQPVITVKKLSAWVPFSLEFGMDSERPVEELTKLLADAAERLSDVAFWSGVSGSGQPVGIRTALAGGAQIVSPATPEAFVAGDVIKTQNALAPRFQATASWVAELSTLNAIGGFETTAGSIRFPELGDGRLLRKPVAEWSSMDAYSAVNTAATADHYILGYGSWRDAFAIITRIGTTVELVPHVFGANNRPTGERGLFMFARVGSDTLVDEAAVLLNLATAA